MGEFYKDIPGYEGRYQISEDGQVRNIRSWRFIKRMLNSEYPYVLLYKHCKTTRPHVHILVARAFVPNPDNKPQVNHKDSDKFNCHCTNLEWVTRAENQDHSLRSGFWRPWRRQPIQVEVIDRRTGVVLMRYRSLKQASRALKCPMDFITGYFPFNPGPPPFFQIKQ